MIVCSFSILYFCSPSFGGHAAVGVSAACSCYTPTMSSLAPYSQDRHTHTHSCTHPKCFILHVAHALTRLQKVIAVVVVGSVKKGSRFIQVLIFFLPSVGRREGKVSHFVPILLLHRWQTFLFPNVADFFRETVPSPTDHKLFALLVVCCTSSE